MIASPDRTPLPRNFFDRPILEVAPDLLGRVLVRSAPWDGPIALRLTEVEAYDGQNDPGSHAYRGRTPRNDVMFGPPGHVYVYFTYGMWFCMNLVCGPEGRAERRPALGPARSSRAPNWPAPVDSRPEMTRNWPKAPPGWPPPSAWTGPSTAPTPAPPATPPCAS
ncbi:Putative 3-methyladenine DNA glycosylase [Streptomyces fumanus]